MCNERIDENAGLAHFQTSWAFPISPALFTFPIMMGLGAGISTKGNAHLSPFPIVPFTWCQGQGRIVSSCIDSDWTLLDHDPRSPMAPLQSRSIEINPLRMAERKWIIGDLQGRRGDWVHMPPLEHKSVTLHQIPWKSCAAFIQCKLMSKVSSTTTRKKGFCGRKGRTCKRNTLRNLALSM